MDPKDTVDDGLHQKTRPFSGPSVKTPGDNKLHKAVVTEEADSEQPAAEEAEPTSTEEQEEADDTLKRTNAAEPEEEVARAIADDGESTVAGETAEPVGDLGSNALSALVKKLDASLSHSTARTIKR